MKFKVGDRVKVVKDEAMPEYVGSKGVIAAKYDAADDGWDYDVAFAEPICGNIVDGFAEDELDFDHDVKVIEGVVGTSVSGNYVGTFFVGEIGNHDDTVRITVEVLRKAGE